MSTTKPASKSGKDPVKGITLVIHDRNDDGTIIEDSDGLWESSFISGPKGKGNELGLGTKDLMENDSVLFDNAKVYYNSIDQFQEVLSARELHLASPVSGQEYKVTPSGMIRMWVASSEGDESFAPSTGISIE